MKLISGWIAVLAFFWSTFASALSMSPVYVDGRQWLQPVDFILLSWDDISSVCDPISGVCNGSLNSIDVTGYTWANTDEVNNLFNHYLDPIVLSGPDRYTEAGSNWAPQFFADGWLPTQTTLSPLITTGGWKREPGATTEISTGTRAAMSNFFADEETDFAITDNVWFADAREVVTGAWLYSDVPTPTTISMMVIALALLGINRRKIAALHHR